MAVCRQTLLRPEGSVRPNRDCTMNNVLVTELVFFFQMSAVLRTDPELEVPRIEVRIHVNQGRGCRNVHLLSLCKYKIRSQVGMISFAYCDASLSKSQYQRRRSVHHHL
ncbi:hypothetical protein J3459_012012 [Metarhizium acridum]|nr:hypothetical protein J3459_012012 [Metarhizium acridum]